MANLWNEKDEKLLWSFVVAGKKGKTLLDEYNSKASLHRSGGALQARIKALAKRHKKGIPVGVIDSLAPFVGKKPEHLKTQKELLFVYDPHIVEKVTTDLEHDSYSGNGKRLWHVDRVRKYVRQQKNENKQKSFTFETSSALPREVIKQKTNGKVAKDTEATILNTLYQHGCKIDGSVLNEVEQLVRRHQ